MRSGSDASDRRKAARRALELAVDAGRQHHLAHRRLDGGDRGAERHARRAVLNESVTAGNCPWWLIDERRALVS